jgi:hypothetical protein
MGYESEDGFHFGEPIFPAYVISGHFDNTYLNSTAFPQDQRPLARMRFLYVFAGPFPGVRMVGAGIQKFRHRHAEIFSPPSKISKGYDLLSTWKWAADSRGSVELSFFTKLGLAIQFPPQGSHAEQSETKQRNCRAAIGNTVCSR